MINHNPFPSTLRRTGLIALLVWGASFSAGASADPQGLYSADELLDAEVYAQGDNAVAVGEVENILLDNDMRLRALVIDTGNLLDLGEKQYVVEVGRFTVETLNSDRLDRIEYRVHVDMTEEAITQQPQYTDDWWSQARTSTRNAWENTQEGAASAWETTKEGASWTADKIGQALERVGEKTREAANGEE